MARFKDYNYDQVKMLPIDFTRQILPDTFEYNLTYLVERELDLSIFEHRYNNDDNGRPAYDPAILLKIIILAYSRGITSSRKIERLCRENIIFMAISADSQPHFTTIADFISSSSEEIASLFTQILMICDAQGLIGKEMFAIDGCKLPGNASKEWSGTHSELSDKKAKIDSAVKHILNRHKDSDTNEVSDEMREHDQKQVNKLKHTSDKIRKFLADNEDRTGVSGKTVKSNITDNESAKMKTSHGVIQGYTGVATADSQHQVIVQAEAFGQGQEHNLLKPAIEQAHANLGMSKRQIKSTIITADSGYHNLKALEYLDQQQIRSYIADTGFRSRDPRFKDYKRFKPSGRLKPRTKFKSEDFTADTKQQTCVCPAGNEMWLKCARAKIDGSEFMQFQAYEKDCLVCPLKQQCLRRKDQKTPRQVNIMLKQTRQKKAGLIEQMKRRIDSDAGRHIYSQRLGTVEPVFGNITHMIGFKRFSLRGKKKVNGQWQLVCMIHNIFKLHRYAWQ